MKLILENWNKFLKEQEINEATEQEIKYLKDALEIPIEEFPFGNIFGDSYRIIEPVSGLKEETPLANAISILNKFGWQVDPASDLEYHDETKGRLAGKVKGGKIICSKTKISHYIDGKGKQGISRKTIILNLPKVLGGIVNFINNSRDKLKNEAGGRIYYGAMRYTGKSEPRPNEDPKYFLPEGIADDIPYTADEYRNIMKFYDAQNYWLDTMSSDTISVLLKDKGINFITQYPSFENFAKYAIESFDDLIRNMDQYLERNYIIYSRHPIDVFRMSDHQGIQSCHSLPSEKGEVGFDQYNKCAFSEAYGNGMIAYIIPAKNFKMFPPTQESLDNVDDEEIFYDKSRPDAGELEPTSRIRIKHVAFHKDEDSDPIRVAVPQGKVYGPKVPGFLDAVNNKFSTAQEKQVKEIIKQGAEDLGKPTIFLSKFTRYGGSYQDDGYSVAETLPMLFRKYNRDLVLQGSYVRYEPDVEEALLASIGQNAAEVTRQRLNEIFDDETGGFISFDWDVEEGYEGEVSFSWSMNVTFKINVPSAVDSSEVENAVIDAADNYLTDYYGLPQTDNVFVDRDGANYQVRLVYSGSDLDNVLVTTTYYLDGLENDLPGIIDKMNVFDYYYDDGAIQLIEYVLEEYRVIEAERHNVQNVLRDFDLPDDSWWNEDEREEGEHDYFGGEYISFIAFVDYTSLDIMEIKDKIPENMKQAGYKHIADFLNLVTKSDELAGKLALNQDTWDKIKDPGIVISYDGTTVDLDPKELDQADIIDIKAGVSLYNDYPVQRLQKTAYFLKNNADIDALNERILIALEKYVADKLKGQQNVNESKKRVRINVRR